MSQNAKRNASQILHGLLNMAQASHVIVYDCYDDIHKPRVKFWYSATICQQKEWHNTTTNLNIQQQSQNHNHINFYQKG